MNGKLTFIDFFSGIGGFRLGFELAGHRCVGSCEKDKYAIRSYKAMFDTEGEWFSDDIRNIRPIDIPRADVWTFGFPCQDISVAGRQRGLCGERSGLYFTMLDLVKGKEEADKPEWLVAENVKNLLSIGDGRDFVVVLSEMDEAGYDVEWQVLNSKDFGVPQNRERVFIIGHLRTIGQRKILPVERESPTALKQVIGGSQGYRVYDADGISCTLASQAGGAGAKTGLYFIDQSSVRPKITDYARCIVAKYNAGVTKHKCVNSGVIEAFPVLTPDRMEKRQNDRRLKNANEPMFTLTGQDRHGVAINECDPERRNGQEKQARIRRLTPRECFRLQGFPDRFFDKAQSVNSDAQLYRQAGNAVTVNVAFAIASKLERGYE